MKNVSPFDAQRLKSLNSILDEYKTKGKLTGILFAFYDGELIAENVNKTYDAPQFAAMCASVLGAAFGLGQTMSDRKGNKIIAEVGDHTIIIVKCDDRSFLAFLINKESKTDLILNDLKELIAKISDAYKASLI